MMFEVRSNLPSIQYWRTPLERVPQRFYVAFCLLMSSVQDAYLGQKEREASNLNWSATCSYYSLVHGGRLLCFLALGDYPTQHNKLRDILSTVQRQNGNLPSRQDRYPFDWLRKFDVQTNRQLRQPVANTGLPTSDYRQIIAAYLNQVQVTDSDEHLTKYGNMLAAAAPLRNDSNYEALLIAHEYQHVTISNAFEKLSLCMATAADATLPFLIDAFNGFRHHDDPELREPYEQYESFLHEYVHIRIGRAIRRKLGGSISLQTKLDDVLRLIGTRPTGAQYGHLENKISMALFTGKARLMRDFEQRIEELSNVTVK